MKSFYLGCLTAIALIDIPNDGNSQFLSNLKASSTDALYTTYAAPPERSAYLNDQGYQFQWFDDESGVEFISDNGPNLGIAFEKCNRLIFKLQELYREPVITASYSDLVKYYFYPFKGLRVEIFFSVFSSETAIFQCRLVNEGAFMITFNIHPYLYYPSPDGENDITANTGRYTFPMQRRRDRWMVEHQIPVAESLTGSMTLMGCNSPSGWTFVRHPAKNPLSDEASPFESLIQSFLKKKFTGNYVKGIIRNRKISLQPGDATSFRMVVDISEEGKREAGYTREDQGSVDLERLLKADEVAYSGIPRLAFSTRDDEMLYWSAFSLMRQCMMPPEGSCHHNYYVFSREPKWGWGYGGQVFHESLAMMAYAYMDPMGAMESQRIYFDRQRPDGYINYRTGPWLDETIETNGRPTSSAPWFNYENLEIYKVSRDKKFLQEAYIHGMKFYQYYVANRDTNQNGLCEWGGHAELESVRDARVAVWDKVGWPSNFEGPDVNSMLVAEATSLSEMAGFLNLPADRKYWHDDASNRSKLINKYLWDDETGFYYNVNRNDQGFSFRSDDDLKIKEIIGFLPLWAGVADSAQAARLIETMLDPSEFWRAYGVPSLSAASDYYNPIGYWNGPVWVQWQYLLSRGLRDYGYHQIADQLSERVLKNMIFHLKKDHVFWEFYSADDLQAGWNKTYIWAGTAIRFFTDRSNLTKQN